jgi:predicted dehydrogenase
MSVYAGGIVIDQGAHIYDAIHMIMDAGYPTAVNASACKGHIAGADMPESVVVVAEYPEDFLAVFTINYAAMRYPQQLDQSNSYDGDGARMDLGREYLQIWESGKAEEPAYAKEQPGGFGQATVDHDSNFLECVRTRATPSATIEKGFHAALILQLANMSLKQGRRVRWNRETLQVEA